MNDVNFNFDLATFITMGLKALRKKYGKKEFDRRISLALKELLSKNNPNFDYVEQILT